MFQWLAERVSSFQVNHNAHRQSSLDVARHLDLRARMGDIVMFSSDRDRELCVATGEIWELRAFLPDGAMIDIGGSDLKQCLDGARMVINQLSFSRAA